jgi:hypothetical protein
MTGSLVGTWDGGRGSRLTRCCKEISSAGVFLQTVHKYSITNYQTDSEIHACWLAVPLYKLFQGLWGSHNCIEFPASSTHLLHTHLAISVTALSFCGKKNI